MIKQLFITSLIAILPIISISGAENAQESHVQTIITQKNNKLSALEITCGTIAKYLLYIDALGSGIGAFGCFVSLVSPSTEEQIVRFFLDPARTNQIVIAGLGLLANTIFSYKIACVLNHGLER